MKRNYSVILICVFLALSTLAVYWQVLDYDFINYDDPKYVTENKHLQKGLTHESILWAFRSLEFGHYNPLTRLSLIMDYELYGLNAGGYHATNLLFHVVNTLLLFIILTRMTGALWRSAFVAALFALHPLHVESVAWVTERKDVLSTFFFFIAILAYIYYVKKPTFTKYILIVLAFLSGLMSKSMIVTLPFVLLLLDYWPLGRIQRIRPIKEKASAPNSSKLTLPHLVLEKAPLILISILWSFLTLFTSQNVGAVQTLETLPMSVRIVNALASYIIYLKKTIWPQHLAIFYPYSVSELSLWKGILTGLLLLCLSFTLIRLSRKSPYLAFGWFWYIGTLVPVIGVVQIGDYSMADRYTYFPLIGIFTMIAWGLPDLLSKWRHRKNALMLSAGLLISSLMIVSWSQLRHWQNSITLFEHALHATENNYVAHNNLGIAFGKNGMIAEAIDHYRSALMIKPDSELAHYNLGTLFAEQKGRTEEAVAHFRKALTINPDSVLSHYNLGNLLSERGRIEESISHYMAVIKINPNFALAHNNLGIAFSGQGETEKAINHFRTVVKLNPDFAEARINLGIALFATGKTKEAISHYKAAIKIKPDFAPAHYNLGVALLKMELHEEAALYFSEALRIKPDYSDARDNLAAIIETIPANAEAYNHLGKAMLISGRTKEAIRHLKAAIKLDSGYGIAHFNLGNAMLVTGRLKEAITHYRKVVTILPDHIKARNNLGVALIKTKQPEEAEAHFSKALKIKPDYTDARNNMAIARQLLKKSKE